MCMHLSVIRPSPKKLKTKIKSFRRGAIISAILRNFGQVRHSRVIDALTGRTIDDQPGADVRKSPLWFQVGEILSGNDALTSMPLRSSLLMVFDDYCFVGMTSNTSARCNSVDRYVLPFRRPKSATSWASPHPDVGWSPAAEFMLRVAVLQAGHRCKMDVLNVLTNNNRDL